MKGFFKGRLDTTFDNFVHVFILQEKVLDIFWQYLFNKLRNVVAIDPVAITNSKQVSSIFHEILEDYERVLINLIFFLGAEPAAIAVGVFCYYILLFFIL